MSISSELNRIDGNVSSAFGAVRTMGGTVPSGANSDDLASAIRSIPQEGGGGVIPMTEITWSALKALRDGGQLTPGMQYRITDYNTIVTGYYDLAMLGAQGYLHYGDSAGHQFDVIVTADSEDTLNENARAALHEGDTYFANSDLAAWQLKYCLDNDATRFSFANANGKGVIYWMKDEFDNECGYDFKNWKFVRYALKLADATADYTPEDRCGLVYAAGTQDNRYGSPYHVIMALMSYMDGGSYTNPFTPNAEDGHADYDFAVGQNILGTIQMASIDATYLTTFGADLYYTFDYFDTTAETHSDMTLGNNGLIFCRGNKIPQEIDMMDGFLGTGYARNGVGCSVVECNSVYAQENNSGKVVAFGNTFGMYNFFNTFGNSCYSNTFGNSCYSNTFGNECYSNTFGNECYSNTFGNECYSNTFGNECYSNTFWNNCSSNTFGTDASGNGFDGDFRNCTVDDSTRGNTLHGNGTTFFVHIYGGVQNVEFDSSFFGDYSRLLEIVNYNSGSQYATVITKTGYGQETAVSTTDGGQTWTAA